MDDFFDIVIRGRAVVTSTGVVESAVGVRRGCIEFVGPRDAPINSRRRYDLADDEVLLPGLVDTHVHVNAPGRTEWEGFTTATRAAAAGGVTAIVDMPLNSLPPTLDTYALAEKRAIAKPETYVDLGFWGGVVPGNVRSLAELWSDGVFGFKCFLLDSGVPEFPPLDLRDLETVMSKIAAFDGLLLVHAEDGTEIDLAPPSVGRRYFDFLQSRPREAENKAIKRVIGLSRLTGCRVHVVHVSSADVLDALASARKEGVPISTETCPHYLTFDSESIADGATEFKCCPPIRESANRELLWEGLRDGVLDIVVSDHSPSPPEMKCLETGDFGRAWGGISSLQLGLSAVWTSARDRGFSLADVVEWMSTRPAALAGIKNKGQIAAGMDGDFCVFAPDDQYVVEPATLHHRHALTPYGGMTLRGRVRATWLAGERIEISGKPRGRLLKRGDNE